MDEKELSFGNPPASHVAFSQIASDKKASLKQTSRAINSFQFKVASENENEWERIAFTRDSH